MKAEVAVVGAGPAGLIAARELAGRGIDVKVFEEHPIIGEPNHCAGIISVEGLDRLDIRPSVEFVQHEVRGGTVFSPDGTGITIAGSRIRAYIVDRGEFDRSVSGLAQDRGAEVETGQRISDLIVREGSVAGVKGEKDVRADVVIDCEGAGGFLARKIGLLGPRDGVLSGINVELPGIEVESNMVEVWLGNDLAPGLFAWVVPIGEKGARCGLGCSGRGAEERLEAFLARRFGRVESSECRMWPVLTGGPVPKTFSDGLLLVGDVAGQTKPTTGGGVIMGGLCALDAAEAAAGALENSDTTARSLFQYERSWRGRLGKEFSSMLSLRRFANGVSDQRMDGIFAAMRRAGMEPTLKELVEKGDMDMQSGVLRSALSHPGMARVLVESLGRMALGELRRFFNL